MVWLKFLFCVIVILYAGMQLARYGDAIAEKSGLGRMWIGLVLLAFVTSLPELMTGISSVALVGIPDLAMGTLFGSCTFNLAIVIVLDVIHRGKPVLSGAGKNHLPAGWFGVLLIALAAVFIYFGESMSGISLGWAGVSSIVIIVVYLAAVRFLFQREQKQKKGATEAGFLQYEDMPARTAYLRFTLAAAAVIAAAIWLSFIGKEISDATGWGSSFVGSLFLALTTSMPELAVTIAAIRIGATDMAVADLLGANMINIAKLFPIDLFYTSGPVLSAVSPVHMITALISVLMTAVVMLGIRFQPEKKTFRFISWYGPVLVILYIIGAYCLFTSGMVH